MPEVSVFGLGYVGCVTAACLADRGFRVVGVDVSQAKVDLINGGQATIVEEGIADLVRAGHAAGRLRATTSVADSVHATSISLVCVGTPSLPNGNLDLSYVERVCHQIGEALRPEFPGVREWVISGAVGPRGDGYDPSVRMSEAEAEGYHAAQIGIFAEAAADLVTAITMNYAEEAIGITRAARRAGLPVVLSFTVETDGRLPTGQALTDAISQVDEATATLDHVTPRSKGGSNSPANLSTCCLMCNSIKSGRTYEEAAPDILAAIRSGRQPSE